MMKWYTVHTACNNMHFVRAAAVHTVLKEKKNAIWNTAKEVLLVALAGVDGIFVAPSGRHLLPQYYWHILRFFFCSCQLAVSRETDIGCNNHTNYGYNHT